MTDRLGWNDGELLTPGREEKCAYSAELYRISTKFVNKPNTWIVFLSKPRGLSRSHCSQPQDFPPSLFPPANAFLTVVYVRASLIFSFILENSHEHQM